MSESDCSLFRQWPRFRGRQLEQALPAFTQLHLRQLPLPLHRQQAEQVFFPSDAIIGREWNKIIVMQLLMISITISCVCTTNLVHVADAQWLHYKHALFLHMYFVVCSPRCLSHCYLQVWSVLKGERLLTLQSQTDGVTCLQFNDLKT